MKEKTLNPKPFLIAAFGHLLCWAGGDLLLYFVPNGPLQPALLFHYEDTVRMLQGVNPMQFTVSGVVGVLSMMLALAGYYQIYQFLKPTAGRASIVSLIGALLTCIPGAVMHFTCTSMLWYFVKSGATQAAHEIMLSFFLETMATTVMCNAGVLMACLPLFITVFRRKTCLPKWACLINTLPLTLAASVLFAGMGAMNVGSALMFLGLYIVVPRYSQRQ